MMEGEMLPAPRVSSIAREPVLVSELPPRTREHLLAQAKLKATGLRQVQGLDAMFSEGKITFLPHASRRVPGYSYSAKIGGGELTLKSWTSLCERLVPLGFEWLLTTLDNRATVSGKYGIAELYYIGAKDENLSDVYSFFA